jgi:transposase-like protein
MRKQRKNYSGQEKVIILKRHLVDHLLVSDLCDEYNLQPTVFYRWQREFFENGAAAFEKDNSRQKNALQNSKLNSKPKMKSSQN